MKTRFFSKQSLEGSFIDLDYGSYTFSQINILDNIKSINIPSFTIVTLYSQDNLTGAKHIIKNTSNKSLKIAGFENIFMFKIISLKIECACKVIINPEAEIRITKDFFVRDGQHIGYTLYNVIPEPLTTPLDGPSPFNATAFIIPEFGYNRFMYECLQIKLAQKRISSIILDLRGTGQSYSSTKMKYEDIIEDYRFITKQLKQNIKKPIIIGHGIGGAIAQLWALLHKFELSKLILISTAPYATYTTYNLLNAVTQQWLNGIITTNAFAIAISNATFNTTSKECNSEKLKKDLTQSITSSKIPTLKMLLLQNPDNPVLAMAPKDILTKTLIIYGTKDIYISNGGGNALFALIKNATLEQINSGHSPHLTNPFRLIEILCQFVSPNGKLYFD